VASKNGEVRNREDGVMENMMAPAERGRDETGRRPAMAGGPGSIMGAA